MFEVIPYPVFWVTYFAIGIIAAVVLFRRWVGEVRMFRDSALWFGLVMLCTATVFFWPGVFPALAKS